MTELARFARSLIRDSEKAPLVIFQTETRSLVRHYTHSSYRVARELRGVLSASPHLGRPNRKVRRCITLLESQAQPEAEASEAQIP